jgi:hypothetical protein
LSDSAFKLKEKYFYYLTDIFPKLLVHQAREDFKKPDFGVVIRQKE